MREKAEFGSRASDSAVKVAAVIQIPRELPGAEEEYVMTTKAEFVDKVAAKSGLSKKDAGAAVDAVISSIEDSLKSGDEVSFTGFGKFHVANRGAREGRNPRTGETMTIAASRVPRFTAGSGLKKAVK
jgi:DNA-binding protein HU-beta